MRQPRAPFEPGSRRQASDQPAPARDSFVEGGDKYTVALGAILLALLQVQEIGLVGKILFLVRVAIMAILVLKSKVIAKNIMLRWWPILLLPIYFFLTTLWSDDPAVTGRYSFQLVVTAIGAVALAASMSPMQLSMSIFWSSALVCFLSILSGKTGQSAIGPVLIGLTGSKNQMSFLGQIVLLSSVAVLFAPVRAWIRLVALPCIAMGIFVVGTTEAATGVITSVFRLGLLIGLFMLKGLSVQARAIFVIAFLVCAIPALIVHQDVSAFAEWIRSDVFHKSASLTGRTQLWAYADAMIHERPFLGHGYRAAWLGHTQESYNLRAAFGINEEIAIGFNFHQTLREVTVDGGYIAALIYLSTMAAISVFILYRNLLAPSFPSILLASQWFTLVLKTVSENLLSPFSFHTSLVFIIALYAFHKLPVPSKMGRRVQWRGATPEPMPRSS